MPSAADLPATAAAALSEQELLTALRAAFAEYGSHYYRSLTADFSCVPAVKIIIGCGYTGVQNLFRGRREPIAAEVRLFQEDLDTAGVTTRAIYHDPLYGADASVEFAWDSAADALRFIDHLYAQRPPQCVAATRLRAVLERTDYVIGVSATTDSNGGEVRFHHVTTDVAVEFYAAELGGRRPSSSTWRSQEAFARRFSARVLERTGVPLEVTSDPGCSCGRADRLTFQPINPAQATALAAFLEERHPAAPPITEQE